jgi:hypothetical protein
MLVTTYGFADQQSYPNIRQDAFKVAKVTLANHAKRELLLSRLAMTVCTFAAVYIGSYADKSPLLTGTIVGGVAGQFSGDYGTSIYNYLSQNLQKLVMKKTFPVTKFSILAGNDDTLGGEILSEAFSDLTLSFLDMGIIDSDVAQHITNNLSRLAEIHESDPQSITEAKAAGGVYQAVDLILELSHDHWVAENAPTLDFTILPIDEAIAADYLATKPLGSAQLSILPNLMAFSGPSLLTKRLRVALKAEKPVKFLADEGSAIANQLENSKAITLPELGLRLRFKG